MQIPGGFTVLMALYAKDDLSLFERAVESVYENSLAPDEFVLVIDGPLPAELNNQVKAIAERYPILVVQRANNAGLAAALNDGIRHVKTTWIARADPDDFNISERFAVQARALQSNGDVELIGGTTLEIEHDGRAVSVRTVPLDHESIIKFLSVRNPFNHMTVMFKRSSVLAVGGYPNVYLREDYALWSLLIANGAKCLNVPDILVIATAGRGMYRRRGGIRYAIAEVQLQAHLIRCGIKQPIKAYLHGAIRIVGFLLPTRLRGLLYRRVLRSMADPLLVQNLFSNSPISTMDGTSKRRI